MWLEKHLSGMCKVLGSIPSPEKGETNPADEKEARKTRSSKSSLAMYSVWDRSN